MDYETRQGLRGRGWRSTGWRLDLADGKRAFVKGPGFESLYGSTANADKFNVKYAVYKKPEAVDTYIDPTLTAAAMQ